MEILLRLINKKKEEDKLHGYKVTESSPPISHLLFVDNIFIIWKEALFEAHELVDLRHQCIAITGQEVNYKKSSYYFNKNSPQVQQNDPENHQTSRKENLVNIWATRFSSEFLRLNSLKNLLDESHHE